MKVFFHLLLCSLASLMLVSCGLFGGGGSDSGGAGQAFAGADRDVAGAGGSQSSESQKRAALAKRFSSNYDFETDENGNSRIVTDSKTGFADRDAYSGVKAFSKKGRKYQSSQYQSKKWQGARDHQRRAYADSTKADSRFTKASRQDGKSAREGSQKSRADGNRYATGDYRTGNSRYDRKVSRADGKRTAYVERERDRNSDPHIIPAKQSDGSEYTLEDVKRRLGRKEKEDE